jgi:hypothetical protein
MALLISRRVGAGAVLAAAFALASLSLTAGVANAVPSCPSGWNCVYANINYNDGPGLFQGVTHSWTTLPSGGACVPGVTASRGDTNGSWNDCASSIISNETAREYFWQNAGCTGWAIGLVAGNKIPDLTKIFEPPNGTANDGISANNRAYQTC